MALTDDGTNAAIGRKDRPRNSRQSAPEPPADDTFTVADHNVDEVKDFVNEHPEQVDAVLAAEKDGEQRVTLIEWLESKQDSDDLL
jgi:hypothetical protein